MEKRQESESFDERIEILARELELAIKWQRPSLLLVVYSSEFVRADAETALENCLIDLGQKTVRVRIKNHESGDLLSLLREFHEPGNAVFFIDGLRWGQGQAPGIYTTLNLQREFFVERKVRAIFWLTQKEATDLAHFAPDFWAYRHRVIEFIESPKPAQVLQGALESAWQGIGEYADEFEDTDAKISLREALLTELPSGDETVSTRANLFLTLGILNWRKGDYEKADELLKEALKIAASKIQDNWFEAECYNAIALVKTGMDRIDEAIDAYKQAIRLAPAQIFAWNNLGNLCARIGRNDEAIVAFQKAIDTNPDDPIGWNGLGNVYQKIGYIDDAIAAYRRSIQASPSFAQPWCGLGEVYAGTNRDEDALKAYLKAIELSKNYVLPWIRLGALFTKQEKYREAIKAYQQALGLDSRNSMIWDRIGSIHLRLEDYELAAESFSKAIEIDRSYGWAYSNLALTLTHQSKYREAVPLYLRSIELLPEDREKAVSWNRLGNAYRWLNDYDNAIAAYQMADMLDPAVSPRTASSESSAGTGSQALPLPDTRVEHPAETAPTEAKPAGEPPKTDSPQKPVDPAADSKDLEAPLWIFSPIAGAGPGLSTAPAAKTSSLAADQQPQRTSPENPGPLKTGGITMSKPNSSQPTQPNPNLTPGMLPQGNVFNEDELKDVQAENTNAYVWNERGNALFKRGAFDQAIEAYNKAIQLDPAFGWPYSNLALTYLTQNQYAEAVLLYQKGIELSNSDKDKAISWNGLGNVYRCLNDYANAVAAYQKAAELDPETAGMRDGADSFQSGQNSRNAQVWNDLGELFFKAGNYGEAAGAFQKAIEMEPGFGWPYSNLGRVLASQGKYEEAIPLLLKSIDLFQEDKDKAVAWNRLGNVYRKMNDYDNAIKAYQKAVTLNDEGVSLLTRTRFSLLSNCYIE